MTVTSQNHISIVMPNYNHGQYLGSALAAILAQTRCTTEIILIDDASSDNSLQMMRQFQLQEQDHITIKILCNSERKGVVAAMNDGLKVAKGDLIAFLAADDLILPAFLEKTAEMLDQQRDAPFACGMVNLMYEDHTHIAGRPIIRPTRQQKYLNPVEVRGILLDADNFFMGPATLYRRQPLIENGGFDSSLGSFADSMMQRLLAVRSGFCFIPEPLAFWRMHGDNYSVKSATQPETLSSLLARSVELIDCQPKDVFPPQYSELFTRRVRFSAARLQIKEKPPSTPEATEAILSICGGSNIDRIALSFAGRLGPAAKFSSLVWITLRLKPYSLRLICSEWIMRKLGR